jgi:hypothetical protein
MNCVQVLEAVPWGLRGHRPCGQARRRRENWRGVRGGCFPPPLCRGLFVLSRSVGALAHAFEELLSGERNKGPIPRQLIWTYTGAPARELPRDRAGGST